MAAFHPEDGAVSPDSRLRGEETFSIDRGTPAPPYDAGMNEGNSGAVAEQALEFFRDAVGRVPLATWDQPSNLEGWSVRELVGHATGGATKLVTLLEGGQVWGVSEPADWIVPDPAGRLAELGERLPAALSGVDWHAPRPSPQGEVPLRQAVRFPIADLALHGWDLHRCCGRQVKLPAPLLEFSRALVDSAPEHLLRRPGAFGPARPAPNDADPTTRLMAYLGRDVSTAP